MPKTRVQISPSESALRDIDNLKDALGKSQLEVMELALFVLEWQLDKQEKGLEISYEEHGVKKVPVFPLLRKP